MKEIIKFFIYCFVTCFIVKYALNHFEFSLEIISFSLIVSLFGTLGWYLGGYIKINKKK